MGGARVEDDRFLGGLGRFVGNLSADGALVAHFARSPVANRRITRLDIAAARAAAAPGVHAVLTAEDVAAAGAFSVAGTDMRVELSEIVRWAKAQPSLPAEVRHEPLCGLRRFDGEASTFPHGCNVFEQDVDPETGAVRVVALVSVDDLGREMSPAIVDGQLHGAITQGIGRALHERVVQDRTSGQLLSGSCLDYALPRAADLPP